MRALLAVALLAAAGCELVDPMLHQPKVKPYRESGFYPDQRRDAAAAAGHAGRVVAERSRRGGDRTQPGRDPRRADSVAVSPGLLETGRKRFEVFCAVCHGVLGNGQTPVARNMSVRRRLRCSTTRAARRFFFAVMTDGYGYMPSYRPWLDTEERWAVVAYLRALQLSQHARLDQAPPDGAGPPGKGDPMNAPAFSGGRSLVTRAAVAGVRRPWAHRAGAALDTRRALFAYLTAYTFWVGIAAAALVFLMANEAAGRPLVRGGAPAARDHPGGARRPRRPLPAHRAGDEAALPLGRPGGGGPHRLGPGGPRPGEPGRAHVGAPPRLAERSPSSSSGRCSTFSCSSGWRRCCAAGR